MLLLKAAPICYFIWLVMKEWEEFLSYRGRSLIYFHLFSVFSNLLMLVLPIYTIQIFNRVLFSNSSETLFYLVVIALFLLAIQSISDYGRQQILENIATIYESQFKELALEHSLKNTTKGNIFEFDYKRHTLIRQYLASPFHRCIADIPWTLLFLFVLYILHPVIGLYSMVVALFLAALTVMFVLRSATATKRVKSLKATLTNATLELIKRKELGQSLLYWDRELKRQTCNEQLVLADEVSTKRLQNRAMTTVRLARVYIQVGVFAVGAWLVIEQEILAGSLLAASILLSRVLAPIEQGAAHYSSWKESRQVYLGFRQHMSSREAERKCVDIPVDSAELVVDGLVYRAADDTPILKGINLALKPGSCLEIRGDSGAGKSTLLSLLSRTASPSSGKVRLNGVDIEHISMDCFRQTVAYAAQEPEIFSASIADNISAFDKGEGVAQRVFKASHSAHCHLFISRFVDSYMTSLDSKGQKLSFGEKKKLSLARCFYAQPKLMILDDPTQLSDPISSKAIAKHLQMLKQSGVSIVMVTSDPELKKLSDYSVELKRGVITQVTELKKPVNQIKSYAQSSGI